MSSRAEEVANAVLYEGYILYPYRPSSVKNQQRWNFGVVYPPESSEGAATMQTECVGMVSSGGAQPELQVKVRFLQLMARTVAELDEPVAELPEGGGAGLRICYKRSSATARFFRPGRKAWSGRFFFPIAVWRKWRVGPSAAILNFHPAGRRNRCAILTGALPG